MIYENLQMSVWVKKINNHQGERYIETNRTSGNSYFSILLFQSHNANIIIKCHAF